ncbi:MAG TPA: hypothetical protein VMK65_10965 [Longimicrobiales bacterium]|nr:hypothetical protein [Longimicrobiales bacterium]
MKQHRSGWTRPLLALALALAASAAPAAAQITVAPLHVVTSDRARFQTFYVRNDTDEAQEISIAFRFGYPVTDTLGNATMLYGDSLALAPDHAMTEWVRAFPRQFLLRPGERQSVRVAVRPPEGLADGVYWTRLVTTSTPQLPPPEPSEEEVTTRFIFRIEQVTTVLFQRGAARVDVAVGNVRHWLDEGYVRFLIPLTCTGTAPFLGEIHLRVLDAAEAVVGEGSQTLSSYSDEHAAGFSIERWNLPPGAYRAEIRVTNARTDIPPPQRFTMTPVTVTVPFVIPD